MNYAEDRLDRKARRRRKETEIETTPTDSSSSSSSDSLLWHDFRSGLIRSDHGLLGRTLRDIGWIRHSVFHFAKAIGRATETINNTCCTTNQDDNQDDYYDPDYDNRVSDYAQMTEFAGYPEIGILVLLCHRIRKKDDKSRDDQQQQQQQQQQQHRLDSLDPNTWLQQSTPPMTDCGCGFKDCGAFDCYLRLSDSDLQIVLDAIESYMQSFHTISTINTTAPITPPPPPPPHHNNHNHRNDKHKQQGREDNNNNTSTAYQVLTQLANHQSPTSGTEIPPILQFWRSSNDHDHDHDHHNATNYFRILQPATKLLLTKLLYQTLPPLAAEAVVRTEYPKSTMAQDFKSHNAYQVLIRALVLGERIKPGRIHKLMPYYHVPVWDILFGHNQRHSHDRAIPTKWDMGKPQEVRQHFQDVVDFCRRRGEGEGAWQHIQQTQNPSTSPAPSPPPPPLLFSNNNNAFSTSSYAAASIPPLYIIGDSHILSIAWQIVKLPHSADDPDAGSGEFRQIVPVLVTGLKAWHCRASTKFFTHYLLKKMLARIATSVGTVKTHNNNSNSNSNILLMSVGEIDCREGIGGPQLQGYKDGIPKERVKHTVDELITGLSQLLSSSTTSNRILLLPVAPHAYKSERYGKALGRSVRRQLTQYWNQCLRDRLISSSTSFVSIVTEEEEEEEDDDRIRNHEKLNQNLFFVDYESDLLVASGDYVLKPALNADSTHMNSAFLPYLENALQ